MHKDTTTVNVIRGNGAKAPATRGDRVVTPGGGEGLYIGRSPAGVEYVYYFDNGGDFRSACRLFDKNNRHFESGFGGMS